MFLPRPPRMPHHGMLPKAALFLMAARSVALALLVGLTVALPAPAMAQSLPEHFQFQEKRVAVDGVTCLYLSEVTIRRDLVLVAPLKRDCGDGSDYFSADEGYVFPLNGKDEHSRICEVAKGENPPINCSDGEKSTLRGATTKEPLRMESTISHAAKWTGSRLILNLDDYEVFYTLAGGSGAKPRRNHIVYHLEFSFSESQCSIELVKRSMLANGRNQLIISVDSLGCQILR